MCFSLSYIINYFTNSKYPLGWKKYIFEVCLSTKYPMSVSTSGKKTYP